MTVLNEYIQVSQEDRPCVDFESSLNVDSVVSGYVPVKSTLDVFAFLAESAGMHSPRGRGVICWGSYGSGKSRLCAVLARLFRDGFESTALEPVWSRFKARGLDESVASLRRALLPPGRAWRPWLVVPIYAGGGGGTLSSCFVRALAKSLRTAGVSDDVLKHTVYSEAARRLRDMIQSGKQYVPRPQTRYSTADMMIRALETDLDEVALTEFEAFHREVTAGVEFRTYIQAAGGVEMEAYAVYNEVAKNIQQYGFDGIVVLWDEMGFAVEQLLSEARAGHRNLGQEAIALQNFLERSCGSHELGKRIIFLGMTHVGITEYGTRSGLDNQDQNRLETVAARFRQPNINIRLSITEMEGYHLVAGMMHRTAKGTALFQNPVPRIQRIADLMRRSHKNWEHLDPELCYSDIAAACYPLHPSTVMVLLLLSSQIAQENRTTFYYLQDRQEGGLAAALEQRTLPPLQEIGGDELVRISDLFAFFEQSLRARDHRLCDQFDDAQQRVPDPAEIDIAILRTILILCVAKVPTTTAFICFCLADCSPSEPKSSAINEAFARLKAADAIWMNDSTNVWSFVGGVGVRSGADREVEDQMSLIPDDSATMLFRRYPNIHADIADFLGDFDLDPAPSGIVRRITVKVLDIAKGPDAIEKVNPASSGDDVHWRSAVIYLVVPSTIEELRHWRAAVETVTEQNVFFAIPQEPVALSSSMREFIAVSEVLKKKDRSEHAYNVLEGRFTKLRQELQRDFANTFGSSGLRSGTEIIRCGKPPEVVSVESWSDLLPSISTSLSAVYSAELKVRCTKFNEWLPRREGWTAVSKICERILSFDEEPGYREPLLGFNETSLEAAVTDGVLLENGVFRYDALNESWGFAPLEELPEAFREAAKHIQSSASGEREFVKLYAKLTEPPFGVPNGIVPLIVASVLRSDPARIAIYRRGTRVGGKIHDALVEMAKDPSQFTTRYTKLTGKQRFVFKALGPQVGIALSAREDRGDAFYDYCGRVRDALMDWARPLPEDAAIGPDASDNHKKVFRLLRAAIPSQVSLLADALLLLIGEDTATHPEMDAADSETRDFPATVQRWKNIKEQVDRRISGVKAAVDRAISDSIDTSAADPRGQLLASLKVFESAPIPHDNPISELITQLNQKERSHSDIAVEVAAAVSHKDPAKLTAEDFGLAAGVLKMARVFENTLRKRAIVLPSGNRIELPDTVPADLIARVTEDLKRLKDEFGIADHAIVASAVVTSLFETELPDEAPAEPPLPLPMSTTGDETENLREAGST